MAKANRKESRKDKLAKLGEGSLAWLKARSKGHDFDKTLSDLENAFMYDFTIIEACRHADIHPDTYYEWLKISDEFRARMDKAQDFPAKAAKRVISRAINENDKDAAKWWLERRKRDEYSIKTVGESSNLNINTEVKLSEDEQESIRAAFRELRGEENSSGE